MGQEIVELKCPGCGARVTTAQKECEYCHKPIVISSFRSVYSMPAPDVNKYAGAYRQALKDHPESDILHKSAAMCFLKLGLYDKALSSFEKAIDDDLDDAETYFYAAVSILKGKKAFLARRGDIDKAVEYIDAANMIEPRGIFYYFLGYIKYDFFERKFLNTTPDYRMCLQTADEYGTSEADKEMLFNVLKVARPDFM